MYSAKELALARQIKPDIELAQLDATDLAVLQLVRKATGGGSGIYNANITNGIASFDGVTVSKPLVSLKLNIPITQEGSGTPSPDNIREFIGFSGVNIGQTSEYGEYFKGLLNGSYGFVDLGSLTWNPPNAYGIVSKAIVFPYVPNAYGGSYSDTVCDALSVNYEASSVKTVYTDHINKTITFSESNICYICDTEFIGKTVSEVKNLLNGVYLIYKIATPTTPITPQDFATLCQAFGITGNTYQITFGQTVYSANLDVLTGVLSITHGIVDLGDLAWQYRDTYELFYSGVNRDVKIGTPNCACSGYLFNPDAIDTSTSAISRKMNDKEITTFENENNQGRFAVKDLDYSTAADFKTAVTGIKLVYELATPIEVQLTPTQVTTLIGENVIFADVANVTECKYTRK